MMKTADFDYDLPPDLIAQTPLEPRDSSRLLVYNRQSKATLHTHTGATRELWGLSQREIPSTFKRTLVGGP